MRAEITSLCVALRSDFPRVTAFECGRTPAIVVRCNRVRHEVVVYPGDGVAGGNHQFRGNEFEVADSDDVMLRFGSDAGGAQYAAVPYDCRKVRTSASFLQSCDHLLGVLLVRFEDLQCLDEKGLYLRVFEVGYESATDKAVHRLVVT